MKVRVQVWLALAMIGAASAAGSTAGCGDSTGSGGAGGGSGGAAPDPCFDYTKYDGKTPATTFRKDVLPIFRRSCGLSDSCHGPDSTGGINLPPNQPYLGPAIGDKDPSAADIKMILDGIVQKASQIPTANGGVAPEPDKFNIVEPDHPENSFLMWKIDAVYNTNEGTSSFCSKLKCSPDNGCGDSMPQGGPELVEADKTKIRLWIAQGAQDD